MLTPKEEKVLQCITRYIAIQGHGPQGHDPSLCQSPGK